jgi:hypothetical protein
MGAASLETLRVLQCAFGPKTLAFANPQISRAVLETLRV